MAKAKTGTRLRPKATKEQREEVTPLLHKGANAPKKRKNFALASVKPGTTDISEPTKPKARDTGKAARTELKRQLDEAAVLDLRVQGVSVHDIATRLSISQSQVYKHIASLQVQVAHRAGESVEELRAVQSMQIDKLLNRCFEAIERSSQPLKKTTTTVLHGVATKGKIVPARTTSVKAERVADVNHIFAATGLLARKAKLLGLDAPVQLNLVHEASTGAKKDIFTLITKHVKDPAVIKAIAEDMQNSSVQVVDAELIDEGNEE